MGTFLKWLGTFLDAHWGDFIGIVLIFAGAKLVYGANGNAQVLALGSSLVTSGAVLLRPRPANGGLTSLFPQNKNGENKQP